MLLHDIFHTILKDAFEVKELGGRMLLEKSKKLKWGELCVTVITILMIYQPVLEQVFLSAKWFDELAALLILLFGLLINKFGDKITREECGILVGLFIYNIFGWISSFVYEYQNLTISLSAWFLANKYFMLMIGGYLCSMKWEQIICSSVKKSARWVLVSILLWQTIGKIMGLPMFDVLSLIARVVAILGIIIWDWRGKGDFVFFAISLLLFLSTRKAKAVGAIIVFICVYLVVEVFQKRIRLTQIMITAVVCIVALWKKIYLYYISGAKVNYPRPTLFYQGFLLANQYFPLGTGWGTFGSHFANVCYSPVYDIIGWNNMRDFSGERAIAFLTDAYWPGVYCETGWFGLIGILVTLVAIYYYVQKIYLHDKKMYMAGMFFLGYMMIITIESTAFSHPATNCIGAGLGVMLGMERKISNKNYLLYRHAGVRPVRPAKGVSPRRRKSCTERE